MSKGDKLWQNYALSYKKVQKTFHNLTITVYPIVKLAVLTFSLQY